MNRILGLDPGLASCGYAYLVDSALVECGVWRTSPRHGSHARRLASLVEEFRCLLDRMQPEALALETQYLRPDLPGGVGRSVLMVARVAGAFVGVARERGLGVVEVTPQRAKLGLAGRGNADKRQMVEAANRRFGLALKLKDEHAADALGMALAGEGEWRLRGLGWTRTNEPECEQYLERPVDPEPRRKVKQRVIG